MLADPPTSLYLILIVATIIAAAVCAKIQSKRNIIIFASSAAVLLGLFLIGQFVESPRKESIRKVQLMAKALSESNVDGFLENVSPRFDMGGRQKESLKDSPLWGTIREWNAQIEVFDFNDFKRLRDDELEFTFAARGSSGNARTLKYCFAQFVKDADGAWRVSNLKFINPATKVEESIPGL